MMVLSSSNCDYRDWPTLRASRAIIRCVVQKLVIGDAQISFTAAALRSTGDSQECSAPLSPSMRFDSTTAAGHLRTFAAELLLESQLLSVQSIEHKVAIEGGHCWITTMADGPLIETLCSRGFRSDQGPLKDHLSPTRMQSRRFLNAYRGSRREDLRTRVGDKIVPGAGG